MLEILLVGKKNGQGTTTTQTCGISKFDKKYQGRLFQLISRGVWFSYLQRAEGKKNARNGVKIWY